MITEIFQNDKFTDFAYGNSDDTAVLDLSLKSTFYALLARNSTHILAQFFDDPVRTVRFSLRITDFGKYADRDVEEQGDNHLIVSDPFTMVDFKKKIDKAASGTTISVNEEIFYGLMDMAQKVDEAIDSNISHSRPLLSILMREDADTLIDNFPSNGIHITLEDNKTALASILKQVNQGRRKEQKQIPSYVGNRNFKDQISSSSLMQWNMRLFDVLNGVTILRGHILKAFPLHVHLAILISSCRYTFVDEETTVGVYQFNHLNYYVLMDVLDNVEEYQIIDLLERLNQEFKGYGGIMPYPPSITHTSSLIKKLLTMIDLNNSENVILSGRLLRNIRLTRKF